LSEYHFHRIFKSITGETVKDFLIRLRLERAAMQMKHNPDEIGQIALRHGYENHESFSRAFKQYFQVPPQVYRKEARDRAVQKQREYQRRAFSLENLHINPPHIQSFPDLHLAFVRHNGSYDRVAASFQRLMLWAAAHLVLQLRPTTLGIVHDSPEITEEPKIRFDACVLLSRAIQPKGEIGYKEIPGGRYAVFRYTGPYDGFYTVYDYIYNVCLFEKGWELADKPALEWYRKSPPFYKPAQYVTDFCVPIK
jgi:AraC family transcriptional regulator